MSIFELILTSMSDQKKSYSNMSQNTGKHNTKSIKIFNFSGGTNPGPPGRLSSRPSSSEHNFGFWNFGFLAVFKVKTVPAMLQD